MVRLQLLGTVRLLDADGRDIRAVMQQPKRLAVLAYLAAARPRGAQRRDRLVGLFWAESDESSARRSLSQTLYFLRQKIGTEVFAGRFGEEVGLREDALWCDVVAFEQALDEGRAAEALALYGGDLLAGFHISDAPEWEKWLDTERDRLRDRAASAAWSLAGSEEGVGHAGAAAHWARWAAALNPYDEEQHRRMLELLVRTGDRAGALRAHEEFSRRLATEFEIDPSPETAALIAAIRQDEGPLAGAMVERAARGLERRPEPPLPTAQPGRDTAINDDPVATGHTAADPLSAGSVGRRSWMRHLTRRRIALALLVTAALSVLYLGTRRRADGVGIARPEQPLNRIAILPFRDVSPGGELGYVAEGLATTLTDRLAAVDQLSVVSASTTRQFTSRELTVDSLGRALDVGAVVEATVSGAGNEVRVMVELIDARTGTTVATETLQRQQGDVFALLDDLASSVAWMLRSELGQEIQLRETSRETESVRAWELVQRARETLGSVAGLSVPAARERLRAAIANVDEAIALDPDYIAAHVERSRAFYTLMLRHLDDRERAVALLDSAETAAGRAIAADPDAAEALEQRGNVRFLAWIFRAQPNDEETLRLAEEDARRAIAADPNRARSAALLSQILFHRGNFEQAYYAASRAYRADAYAERVEDVLLRLFETSFELGNDDEAAKWCDELRRRASGSWLHYQCEMTLLAFGTDGEPDVRKALLALDAAKRAPSVVNTENAIWELTALLGASYARAGVADSARAVINRALDASNDLAVVRIAAATLLRIGEQQQGRALLQHYLTTLPNQRQRIRASRLFAQIDDTVSLN